MITRSDRSVSFDAYDYPGYYDLVYGSDWRDEFNFLLACFKKYSMRPVRRVFEPACGTGRLLFRFARAGFHVTGMDLNTRAVDYCNTRFRRRGWSDSAFVGDMSSFRLSTPIDAAFNMINSFRHLTTEQKARNHMRCMADSLLDGGLYVVGLYLEPANRRCMVNESWRAKRGGLAVTSCVRTVKCDTRRRQERLIMTYEVKTSRRRAHLSSAMVFRTYNLLQFLTLLRETPQFEVADVFDFRYDVNAAIVPSASTRDAIFVLRKRSGPSTQKKIAGP